MFLGCPPKLGLLVVSFALLYDQSFAQCTASGTRTISDASDATAIASCSTFTGNLAIATGISGSIALDSIESIEGGLHVLDSSITALSGDSLVDIKGNFTVAGLQQLSNFSFPKLVQVDDAIWSNLPALQRLSLDAGISRAASIYINNTGLNALLGVSQVKQLDSIAIENNHNLLQLELLLENFTDSVSIRGNAPGLGINFPFLKSTVNMVVSNATSINLPELASVNGSTEFLANSFAEFATPKLETIGGSLHVNNNTQLTNISLPVLKYIGGTLQIGENFKVTELRLDNVQTIAGALDLLGSFENISLAKIESIKGAAKIQSNGSIGEWCDKMKDLRGSLIRGQFVCTSGSEKPQTTSATETPDASPAVNGTAISTGAKAGIGIGVGGGLALAIVGALFLYRRRHGKQNKPTEPEKLEPEGLTEPQLAELTGNPLYQELGTGKEAQELDAPHGRVEAASTTPAELPA